MAGSAFVFDVLQDAFGRQPSPDRTVVIVTAVAALLAVLLRPVWKIMRNFVTIAHEGGHALAAVLSGRRLSGIRLHSDTSGLTLSKGRPNGPGMVVTGLSGYITPSLLGLAAAAILGAGRITILLWLLLLLLVLMLIMIRNFYGVISVVAAGAIIFAVSWFADSQIQGAFAYAFAWFMLLGGVRAVFELQQSRFRRQAPNSDADQIARLTRVPAMVYVGFFVIVVLACLAFGVRLMLGPVGDLIG
ncbi:M50 family metallopeptidase [Dactylosporangium darangshiense]|uniref:M50 family metallopeptidase n=1 Tax=Dactylosporangium darangshiense TaxID=579108 RepID=A0ABP8DG41_9ACTN